MCIMCISITDGSGLFFFFKNAAPPEFHPLPLPDPLPFWRVSRCLFFPGPALGAGTAAAICVLLLFLVVMNAIAVFLRKRFERRW